MKQDSKNIDCSNPNAITAFSPEAHRIFRSTSLSLLQSDRFEHQESNYKKDKDRISLANEVDKNE